MTDEDEETQNDGPTEREDKTVLVIEDSSVVSDLIRDLLEAARLNVVQAATSKDGLLLLDGRTFDAVLVDAGMPGTDGYGVLSAIREKPGHTKTPVILITSKGRDKDSRPNEKVQPNDYIQEPIDPVDLIVRVRNAVGRGTPQVVVSSSGPAFERTPRTEGGKLITVFSLKGGVGTSLLAVNLAVSLRKLWEEAVALVDLGLESGSLNVLLDIVPTSTIDELVTQNGNLSADVIGQYLVTHKSGVSLLSAPNSPEKAELVSGSGLRSVLTVLREAFDYVVVDTASNFSDATLLALEMADHIVVPITGDITAVRAATTALEIFQVLGIPDERIVPVFNEIIPKVGLTRKHVESNLRLTLTSLPSGGAKVMDSINLGNPLVLAEPELATSLAIENLAYDLSAPESKGKERLRASDRLQRLKKRLGL